MTPPDPAAAAGLPLYPLTPNDFAWSVGIAVAASLLLALVEVPSRSKTPIAACLNFQSLVYWIILSFGNAVTTILASLAVVKLPNEISAYYYLLCAFFGVFAFETILKNTNVTVFDRGVLTIQDWINKALNAAASSAVDNQVTEKHKQEARIVTKLMHLSEKEINTLILQKFGDGAAAGLDLSAKSSGANAKQYKVLQLASTMTQNEASALLDQ